ncbi:MAG: nucleotide sugar epimerase [Chloroflexi bacterium HGW-Chloroflexi-5]|jgi:nucleoside-diphosphate-sugar epimerase|nr:MAG: nucleotide sugar epimerase [Chloroflexi bacterium HGW-Chloroflexi-5]
MTKYLVTGAAGFIARRVIEKLTSAGHQVVGVDNINDSYDVRLKQWRLNRLSAIKEFSFIKDDICRPGMFDDVSRKHPDCQAVIHLAARAGVRQAVEMPDSYLQTNAAGTLNVLEWCRKMGVKKMVMASTSSIYGANPPLPTPEDADSSHPLQIYAASKKAAEVIVHTYHHLFGLDATIVRFFTVYGPAGRPDMVMFRFAQWVAEGKTVQVTGDGSQMRGFTNLEDIADGVILALKPLGYEIINLGGHETITISELLEKIEQRIGKKARVDYIPRHPADVEANWADVTKAKTLLGWQPRVGLDEGITELVNWYMEQRPWASQVLTP